MRFVGCFALLLSLVLVGSRPIRADQPKAEEQGKALRVAAEKGRHAWCKHCWIGASTSMLWRLL